MHTWHFLDHFPEGCGISPLPKVEAIPHSLGPLWCSEDDQSTIPADVQWGKVWVRVRRKRRVLLTGLITTNFGLNIVVVHKDCILSLI